MGARRRPRSRKFGIDAMAGFVLVIVLLTFGMTLALQRSEHVTSRQLAHVQSAEHEITLVERLRWSAEVFVSAGRAYLISGEPAQLADLNLAKRDLDRALASLQEAGLGPAGVARVAEVRMAALMFRAVQNQLVEERRTSDMMTVIKRFETELLPLRMALRSALDELVGHKSAVIERVYIDAQRDRSESMRLLYLFIALLALGSLGVAWIAAQRLARTYRREIEALETARRAIDTRDELMGIIAHDLRSPLGAITMRAELLNEMTSEPKTREQAVAIKTTAMRMAELARMMLDVSVIEAGQLTIHQAPCDVDRLLRQEVEIQSMLASSKQIDLVCEAPDGLVVMADRERISQVLSNLVGNAIKFTPRGGRVRIAVERAGEDVAFAISDSGPGIPAENLPRVFQRYWKDESRGTKGTGLGLFIAKSIVDAHGGSLSVDSSPDQGATFRFTLPSATSLDSRPT